MNYLYAPTGSCCLACAKGKPCATGDVNASKAVLLYAGGLALLLFLAKGAK